MNPLTLEWIEKAEGDFGTARRELSTAAPRNYDAVCFHAQQCAEKYLKAALQERMIAFPKTHDLAVLIDLLVPHVPEIESWRAGAKRLSGYAVEFRYPGASADEPSATQALADCRAIRQTVRFSLGLGGD